MLLSAASFSVWEIALKQQALKQQALKQQALKQQALKQQALEEQALKTKIIREIREVSIQESEAKFNQTVDIFGNQVLAVLMKIMLE